jgi:uncharacterized membrane protein YccF (DUF307 family)
MTTQPSKPAQTQTTIIQKTQGPGCLVQALWFLFVGWWLGGAATTLAWFLNTIIIGLPVGMAILNNIPKFIALQEPEKYLRVTSRDGSTRVTEIAPPQVNFLIRTVFFLLIGWWWSGIWMSIAYALCMTIILMPIGLQMFRMTPAMTTLRRY